MGETSPVRVDRAGAGDEPAAGQLARRELVDDREREHQPRRRAPDVAEADPDVAGPGLDGRPHAEQALGAVGARGQRDVRRLLLPVAAVGHRHALAGRGAGRAPRTPTRACRPCARRRRRARRRPAAPTRPGSPGRPRRRRPGSGSPAASSRRARRSTRRWRTAGCSPRAPGRRSCRAGRSALRGTTWRVARRPGAQHLHEGQAVRHRHRRHVEVPGRGEGRQAVDGDDRRPVDVAERVVGRARAQRHQRDGHARAEDAQHRRQQGGGQERARPACHEAQPSLHLWISALLRCGVDPQDTTGACAGAVRVPWGHDERAAVRVRLRALGPRPRP